MDDQPTSSAAPRETIEVPLVEEIEEEIPQQTLLEDAEREFPSLDCCVCQLVRISSVGIPEIEMGDESHISSVFDIGIWE